MKLKFYSCTHKITALLVLTLLCHNLIAQEKTIFILDAQTGQAVSDVYFQYNNKSGVSDGSGKIFIDFTEGQSLHLSHIQYGKIQIDDVRLQIVLKSGQLELKASENHLLPVTVLQVRRIAGGQSQLHISSQDKLAHDAGNLMEMVPGISSIRKSGAYGFDPVLRGFKFDQINVVLDGVQTASAACPNRMDPAASQIPVNIISQAEVLKGPHSLRYGNTFGGTINFKSSTPDFKEKTSLLGRIGTSYESNGDIFRTEAVGGISGKRVDFRIFGAYSKGNDYSDGENIKIPARFNRLNWGGKFGCKPSQSQEIGILVSNNFAKDVDFPALPMDLREDNTWLVNASHSAVFFDKAISSWNTSVYGTMVDHLMDNYDKIMNPRKVDAVTEAKTRNYGGRTELRFDFGKSFLYGGFDHRYESADGTRTRELLMGPMAGKVFNDNVWQDAQVQRTGVFGEWHYSKTGFQLVFSGRLDFNSSKVNNPADRFSSIYSDLGSSVVHPSLSAGGTSFFNEKLSLGLWLGMATRSPGITERYINQFPVGLDPYEMLGNPKLKPEMNNQLDAVFKYQDVRSNISINVFSSLLRNYISSEIREEIQVAMASSPGVRQFVNIDKALMAGFEATWNQQITGFLNHNMSLSYTYGKNKVLDEPLPEIPPFELRYSLLGSFLKNKLQPEIIWRSVAKQCRIASSYGETKTPGFNVFDTKISWQINKAVSATGGVQNLFDMAFYEHLSRSVRNAEKRPIYSPGRSFYVTLTVDFL